jgi:hypothetical protein
MTRTGAMPPETAIGRSPVENDGVTMDGDTQPIRSKRRNRTGRLSQLDPGLGTPLEAALAQREGGTLAMVERALDRGDTKLAFQPAMRADGSGAMPSTKG